MKIEKLLSLKKETESKEFQHEVLQKQQRKDTEQPLSPNKKPAFKKQESVSQIISQKQIPEFIYELVKPENMPEQLIPGLLKNAA